MTTIKKFIGRELSEVKDDIECLFEETDLYWSTQNDTIKLYSENGSNFALVTVEVDENGIITNI